MLPALQPPPLDAQADWLRLVRLLEPLAAQGSPVETVSMKIAFLLTQSIDSPSGLGRYFPLARQLVRLGHQVTILALHPDFATLAQKAKQVDGVRIVYVSQMHVRKRGSSKSYFSSPTLLFHAALATWRLTLAAIQAPGRHHPCLQAPPDERRRRLDRPQAPRQPALAGL